MSEIGLSLDFSTEMTSTKDDLRDALPEEMRDLFDELIDGMESELEEVKASRDEVEAELENRDADVFNVLRAVRDWFDNVILLGRPMQDPRAVWKKVERALES